MRGKEHTETLINPVTPVTPESIPIVDHLLAFLFASDHIDDVVVGHGGVTVDGVGDGLAFTPLQRSVNDKHTRSLPCEYGHRGEDCPPGRG